MPKSKMSYTIVCVKTNSHYDTNDQRFYSESFTKTYDSREYLESLIESNPNKFHNCKIEKKL